MLYNTSFEAFNLEIRRKPVPLHCVFHSIRFKVNKGWSSAELLFFCPYATQAISCVIASAYVLLSRICSTQHVGNSPSKSRTTVFIPFSG